MPTNLACGQICGQPDLWGGMLLGHGSFNYVFKHGNIAVRVGYHSVDSIHEGSQVLESMQPLRRRLGPALLTQYKHLFVTRLPAEIRMPEKTDDPGGRYHLELIELVEPIIFAPTDAGNFALTRACSFCLVWFFTAAEGFRHRDLKLQNVGIRRLGEDESTLTFAYGNNTTYSFPNTAYVPVVLDYDFANAPSDTGTAIIVPPESIVQQVLNERGYGGSVFKEYKDWWSLGITLFEWAMGDEYLKIVPKFADTAFGIKTYVRAVWGALMPDLSEEELWADISGTYWVGIGLSALYRAVLVKMALGETNLYLPEAFVQPQIFRQVFRAPEFGAFVRRVHDKISAKDRLLIKQLLDWDPAERERDVLTLHFVDHVVQRRQRPAADYEYVPPLRSVENL